MSIRLFPGISARVAVLCVVMAFLAALPLSGAEPADTLTARYVFGHLKTPALDLLSPGIRQDMIAYYDAGKAFEARNEMQGISTLDSLTRNYASATITPVSDVAIMTVPYGKSGLALLSYTVDAGGADSELIVIDASLRQLPVKKFFTEPVLADFVSAAGMNRKKAAALGELMDFLTVSYTFDPQTLAMTATPTVKDVMSEENYTRLKPYITLPDGSLRTLLYRWDGKALRLQK